MRAVLMFLLCAAILWGASSCDKFKQAATQTVKQVVAANVPQATPPQAAQADSTASDPPPPEQEISVNLEYAGISPVEQKRALDFDFKVLWGNYRNKAQSLTVPASARGGGTSFDLGIARLHISPRIVSDVRGHYDVDLTDTSGSSIGRFVISDSGQQVTLDGTSGKYYGKLAYFDPEKRLTTYAIYKSGTADPEMGVIFVGKGWSYVEGKKPLDVSKGYAFPEVDMVVLPKAWMDNHDIQYTCDTLKCGTATGGGRCYS